MVVVVMIVVVVIIIVVMLVVARMRCEILLSLLDEVVCFLERRRSHEEARKAPRVASGDVVDRTLQHPKRGGLGILPKEFNGLVTTLEGVDRDGVGRVVLRRTLRLPRDEGRRPKPAGLDNLGRQLDVSPGQLDGNPKVEQQVLGVLGVLSHAREHGRHPMRLRIRETGEKLPGVAFGIELRVWASRDPDGVLVRPGGAGLRLCKNPDGCHGLCREVAAPHLDHFKAVVYSNTPSTNSESACAASRTAPIA